MNTSDDSLSYMNACVSTLSEEERKGLARTGSYESRAEGTEEESQELRERIKQEEFVRRQHEHTIEDLKNRMKHLEGELKSTAQEGKERSSVKEVAEQLEVVLRERDAARRDCQQLQSRLSQLRQSLPPPTPALSESLQRKLDDLQRKLQETRRTNHDLVVRIEKMKGETSESDRKLVEIERRMGSLEADFEQETAKTAVFQSKLQVEDSGSVLESVTRQISANEDKVLALELQLATAESACGRLKRAINDSKTAIRPPSNSSSEDILPYFLTESPSGHRKKGNKSMSKPKKRTKSERIKHPSARISK